MERARNGLSAFSKAAAQPNPFFCAIEFYEAAVGDLTQPAIKTHSVSNKLAEKNDW
jgi:hypothetical protein